MGVGIMRSICRGKTAKLEVRRLEGGRFLSRLRSGWRVVKSCRKELGRRLRPHQHEVGYRVDIVQREGRNCRWRRNRNIARDSHHCWIVRIDERLIERRAV